jgi:hypothetical protein
MNPATSITMMEDRKESAYPKLDNTIFQLVLLLVRFFRQSHLYLERVLEGMHDCNKLGATGPLVLHLPLVTVVYWYNADKQDWDIDWFKWRPRFYLGPVTIGF